MMDLAQQLEQKGRGGDTMLAHITPEEAQLLADRGGSATINPETGLPEFGFFSDLWDGFKEVVKTVAPIILPAVAIFVPALIPAIGTFLGASAALAPVIGAAALSAGVTLASGGSLKDALTSGALAGVTTYLSPIVTGAIQSSTGLSATTSSLLSSAAMSGGVAAIRGGSVKQVIAAAATGAASAYLTNLARDAFVKINTSISSGARVQQKGADDSVFVAADAANLKAAGLTQQQIVNTLKASGVNTMAAEIAASEAYKGSDAATIAQKVAVATPNGAYGKAEAGTKSFTAGNNVEILQRVEDQLLIANDAAQLKAQGLSATQISENLQASGVDKIAADYAGRSAVQGMSADKIANGLNSNYGSKVLYTNSDTVTSRDLGQVMTAEQQMAFKSIPYKSMIDAGQLTMQDASVLAANKFTPADTQALIAKGYTGSDLSDLAMVGVPPSTLTSLANTKFAETNINDMMRAGASANDIAVASNVVNSGKISLDNAEKLLYKDYTGSSISSLASNSKVDIESVVNSNLTGSTVSKLQNSGFDINKALAAANAGTDVNALTSNNDWKALNQAIAVATAPVKPPSVVTPTPLPPAPPPAGTGFGDDDTSVFPTTPPTAPVTPVAPPTQVATNPVEGMIASRDAQGNTVYFDPKTNNVVDANGSILIAGNPAQPGPGSNTASNEPRIEVGGVPRDAQNWRPLIEGTALPAGTQPAWPDEYAGYKWNESSNTYVAPSGAYYDNASNTWVMPVANRPSEVTQDLLDQANQSDDPIAWLNNHLNWTPTPGVVTGGTGTGTGPVTGGTGTGTGTGYGDDDTSVFPTTPPTNTGTGTGNGDRITEGDPNPNAVITPGTGTRPVANVDITGGTPVAPPPVVVAPPPVVTPPPLTPLEPVVITPQPPIPEVVVEPPPVVTPPVDPVIPYIPPTPITPPDTPVWRPADFTPLPFGSYGRLPLPGLNPGWVQPAPYYKNNTSPVQSQYYWGPRPYQPGPTFNQALYDQVPAPAVPFGLQQMYQPTNINNYLAQLNQVPGPVAPR